MKRILFFTLIVLLLFGCNKEKYDSIPHGYYTVEYMNFAWGFQHTGWIIDSEGNVMSFDLPSNWNREDSLGYISEADLIDNLSQCNEKIDKVTSRRLYLNNKLIDGAANGTFSERENTSNDAGGMEFSCYQFDQELNLYKKVTLNVEGDWSYHNESEEAEKITKWMKKIK
jgi:hypothetical protein